MDSQQKYLETAREDRITFESTWKNVSDWLSRVEAGPVVTGDSVNFETVQQQLAEHKVEQVLTYSNNIIKPFI